MKKTALSKGSSIFRTKKAKNVNKCGIPQLFLNRMFRKPKFDPQKLY